MDYKKMLGKYTEKISCTVDRTGNFIPYLPDENGLYTKNYAEHDIGWWTNGFWGGVMWQMYNASKDEKYKQVAEYIETQFDRLYLEHFNALHHDVGFMWLHTAVANYRITGDELAKRRGLHAANVLAARFNINGNFIVAWNWESGWMIVDSLMNIPLLFWATEEFGDERFRAIALKHLDTALEYIVREDGSANHICSFDPISGEYLGSVAGQGYSDDSAWSRGLSWVVYGMTMAYKHTSDNRYLDAAKKSANYFITNSLAHDYIAPIDFKSPSIPYCPDTTASAIVASALVDLAGYVTEQEGENYMQVSKKIIKKLNEKHCNYNLETDSVLQAGAERYRKDADPKGIAIVYGDYFLLEALLKLDGESVDLW